MNNMDLENAISGSVLEWDQEKEIFRTINRLTKVLENIRKEELCRYFNRFTEDQCDLIEKISENIMKKLLVSLITKYEMACIRGEAETFTEVLNNLFNLGEKDFIDTIVN